MKPEIATILEDGTYGQREMTDDEYAAYMEIYVEPSKNGLQQIVLAESETA